MMTIRGNIDYIDYIDNIEYKSSKQLLKKTISRNISLTDDYFNMKVI